MDRVSDETLQARLTMLRKWRIGAEPGGLQWLTWGELIPLLEELQQRRAQVCRTCGDRDGCAIVVAVGVDGYCSYWEAKENG